MLEKRNPSFNRADQDGKNRDAAQNLGVRGSFAEWTWENWMAIEVERGLSLSCYACLLADDSAFPDSMGAIVPPDDPRMVLGMLSGDALERYVLGINSRNFESSSRDGIFWRVQAALLYPNDNLNAPETLEAATWLIEQYRTPGGRYLRIDSAWSVFRERGGYVEMTGHEAFQDQYFQAAAVIYMTNQASVVLPSSFSQIMEAALEQCAFDKTGSLTVGHCVGEEVTIFD